MGLIVILFLDILVSFMIIQAIPSWDFWITYGLMFLVLLFVVSCIYNNYANI